jgi:predicted enzyme related to lactoylglutathione lyase
MIKDIAFSAYPAKDVKGLRDWYANVLGLKFSGPFEEDGKLMYDEAQVGNSWFAIMTVDWAGIAPCGGVTFEVDDIEKTIEDLKAKGVDAGPGDMRIYDTPVCRLSGFSDPEGNKITLHQITVPH